MLLSVRDKALLERIFPLLEESFEPEIFYGRDWLAHNVLEEPRFRVVEHREGGATLACMCYFDFPEFHFIEYLATTPVCRGRGIGAELIRSLIALGKPVVLESEPPHDEICRRRIAFYQRQGFHPQPYDYIMPPLGPGKHPEPMVLMSTRDMDPAQLEKLERDLYRNVYRLPENHPGFRDPV